MRERDHAHDDKNDVPKLNSNGTELINLARRLRQEEQRKGDHDKAAPHIQIDDHVSTVDQRRRYDPGAVGDSWRNRALLRLDSRDLGDASPFIVLLVNKCGKLVG